MILKTRRHGRLVAALIQLAISTIVLATTVHAQDTCCPKTDMLLKWSQSELVKIGGDAPEEIDISSPGTGALNNALGLMATSPLAGKSRQPAATSKGGLSFPSSGTTNQATPPISIQLPPHPPEANAPPAQWRPPVQIPDDSTIPVPPVSQAPPQQQRPPMQLPNAATGASEQLPIDPFSIPLPPHPPETQAPWRQ